MSVTSADLRGRLVDFAWDQWAQMGMLAEPRRHDAWVMDPEALVVLTLRVGRSEPRLFDEMLDWLWRNGRLVSVQRLRNLARGDDESRRLVEAAMHWVSTVNGAIRLPNRTLPTPVDEPEPLFLGTERPPRIRRPDPVFEAFGFLRQLVHPGDRSVPPATHEPINLAFKLRLMFGVGTRSECIRCLITDDRSEVGIADIAEAAGFSKRNLTDALAALAAAGMIEATWRRNELRYRIDRARWSEILGVDVADFAPTPNWPALFGALLLIDRWLRERPPDESDLMRASRARDLVEQIGPDLSAAGVSLPPTVSGQHYVVGFERTIDALYDRLSPSQAVGS